MYERVAEMNIRRNFYVSVDGKIQLNSIIIT